MYKKGCHCLVHASVNNKTPDNTARLTAEERERAIGMVQLGANYAHVARILNCTKLMITRLIQRYRVTGRTADRPRSGIPRVKTANETAISAYYTYCDVICSDWPRSCHNLSHCTSSTTTAWYQGLSTI